MEYLVLCILIILLFAVAGRLVPYAGKSTKNSFKLAVLLSTALVPLTVFVLNQSRLMIPQQTEVIEWLADKWQSGKSRRKKYDWVKNNFVFVDNSYSNKIISKPGNQLGNPNVTIVDRGQLAGLLQFLREEARSVDMIICDIFLDMRSPDDSALFALMKDPFISSKLVMGENLDHPTDSYFRNSNDSMFGVISEKADEHHFFSTFQIYKEEQPAWSYKLYNYIEGIRSSPVTNNLLVREKKPGRWASIGLNSYIPHFELTEESELYRSPLGPALTDTSLVATDFNYFELGSVSSDFFELAATLQQRRSKGLRNIIFIGSFKAEDIDLHNTYYGRLHGPTVHLNLAYSLMEHQHRLTVPYLLYLMISFSIIVYVIIRHALQLPFLRNVHKPQRAKIRKNKVAGKVLKFIHPAIHILFLDELHFWLFAFFVFVTAVACGRIVNGLLLFIVLQLLCKVFQYYSQHSIKKIKE